MIWYRIFHAILTGTILSIAGRFLAALFGQNPKEVYHIQKNKADRTILTLISILTGMVIAAIVFFRSEHVSWLTVIPGIILMEIIAVTDLRTCQIPYQLLLIALMSSTYFGILTKQLINYLAGGVVGLSLSLIFYFLGKVYRKSRYPDNTELTVFGFGDVIGAAILGFLLGFPQGFWAFLAALILAVIITGLNSNNHLKDALKSTVRLGPFFYFGYMLVVLVKLFRMLA